MYQRDLGVPFVSFNTRTGHRSSAPEDCGRFVVTLPQGPVPVSGVFSGRCGSCTFWRLGLRQSSFRHITRIPRRAALDAWTRPPVSWHAIFPVHLSDPGSAIRSRDISSRPCPLRERYNAAPRGAATGTTRTARPGHSISTRPQAALPRPPARPSDRYDETASAAWYTSICRSHDVTKLAAPTRRGRR